MKRKNWRILSWLLALVLVVVMSPVGLAIAANTATVTITATPNYVAITDNATSYDFGGVAESATPVTGTSYVTITNGSSVQTDQSINIAGNWTGGAGWVHNDAGAAGDNISALKASRGTGLYTITVTVAGVYIYENCPASENYSYELKLLAPTVFYDGVQKSNTITITAVAG